MECAKKIPGPSGETSVYTTCTYPERGSAAIAGAGRSHPRDPRSSVSTGTLSCQCRPPSALRALTSATLPFDRRCHHTAYDSPGFPAASRIEPSHRLVSGGSVVGGG